MALWGKRSSDGNDAAQAIFPGAVCCMLVGEPVVDPQTGEERRALCGAVATAQWRGRECSLEGEVAAFVIPLCAAHVETYRAAITLSDGSLNREVSPVGTLARIQTEASAEAQEIVDILLATITERLYADLGASEKQVRAIWRACGKALDKRETAVMRPIASPTRQTPEAMLPVQLL